MEKKDLHVQDFKQALTSTIKSISETSDCNINFGKRINYVNIQRKNAEFIEKEHIICAANARLCAQLW